MLGTLHVGTVHGYTMRGQRYLEYDWVPGTFIYEPAGEAHTLVITEDPPEPHIIVEGGLIYLNKSVDGGFAAAYEDGFTALELTSEVPS